MSLASFRPVTGRQTIAAEVYVQLRNALMEGAFEAGAAFAIADLAERFGASNTPVREALRRLTDAGALVEGKWNTATLPPLSSVACADLFAARSVIEGGAAGLAAGRMTAGDLADLRAISEVHRAALQDGRIADMLAANKAFHFAIYRAAGSSVLLEQIENLWLRSGPYTRFLSERMTEILTARGGLEYARSHQDVLEALSQGDADSARSAMQADIEAVHRWLQGYLVDQTADDADGRGPASAQPPDQGRGGETRTDPPCRPGAGSP